MYQRQVEGRCPICGAEHATCGADPLITAMDPRREVVDVQGGPLAVYDVVVNGTKLKLRLSEADARKRGLLSDEPTAPKPSARSKSRRAKNKKVDIETEASGGE